MSKIFMDNTPFILFKYHELSAADDMNNVLESGFYVTRGTNPKNYPASEVNQGQWATIFVYHHDNGQILQRWFVQGNEYKRWLTIPSNGVSAPQTDWIRVATQSSIDSLQAQINDLKSKIGGVLTSLYTKLCGTFKRLEVAA